MRRFLFAMPLIFALAGCGGSSGSSTSSEPRLPGTYEATWVNIADAEDVGASSWTISENGEFSGKDIDVSGEFSYLVFGDVDSSGNVHAMTSRIGSEEIISLTGRLRFDAAGKLVGDLVWASTPPHTYRYTFTRRPSP